MHQILFVSIIASAKIQKFENYHPIKLISRRNLIRRGRGDNSILHRNINTKNSFRDKFSLSLSNVPFLTSKKKKKGKKKERYARFEERLRAIRVTTTQQRFHRNLEGVSVDNALVGI